VLLRSSHTCRAGVRRASPGSSSVQQRREQHQEQLLGVGAAGSAFATSFSLYLLSAAPAVADVADAAGGSTPFQGVTANSLYVTLALFLMTAPGEAGSSPQCTCCGGQSKNSGSNVLRAASRARSMHVLRHHCPSVSPPFPRQPRRHLVTDQACTPSSQEAEDVRGPRPSSAGSHGPGCARTPDLQVMTEETQRQPHCAGFLAKRPQPSRSCQPTADATCLLHQHAHRPAAREPFLTPLHTCCALSPPTLPNTLFHTHPQLLQKVQLPSEGDWGGDYVRGHLCSRQGPGSSRHLLHLCRCGGCVCWAVQYWARAGVCAAAGAAAVIHAWASYGVCCSSQHYVRNMPHQPASQADVLCCVLCSCAAGCQRVKERLEHSSCART
jgi:hypothetical protein